MATLSGKQKVAVLLSTLDTDVVAQIIKNFDDAEIAQISAEIGSVGDIDESTVIRILNEFTDEAAAGPGYHPDFSNSFRKLLERTLGLKKTEEILSGASGEEFSFVPFQSLKEQNPEVLFNTISKEHPQTIALILSHLEPAQASDVITKFPIESQADLLLRIASMDTPSTKLLSQVNEIINNRLEHTEEVVQNVTAEQKLKTVTEIMSMTDVNTEKAVLDIIKQKEPEIAEEIRKLSFVFEDLVNVQDRALRKILSELDNRVVAMALKTASEDVTKKVFGNMSQRVGQAVREEWELLGPRPLSEVEDAQQQVVDAVKALEASGDNVIRRKGSGKADQLV